MTRRDGPAPPGERFERRDIAGVTAAWLGAGFVVAVGILIVAVTLFADGVWDMAPGIVVVPGLQQSDIPPPRLQSAPGAELDAYRAHATRRLASYGWVDRDAGIVHIPISRAIELMLRRADAQEKGP